MLVGNIATLRPLFRHLLNLGSEDSTPAHTKGTPGNSGIPNRSHPYKSFDHDYELGTVVGKGDNRLSTQIHGGQPGRSSASSDNESEKQILKKSGNRFFQNKGIVVSQQVEISRS